ncbi:MAG TPA: DNA methyltransferase [Thiobacillus sp.]|nr:DNA methyltransferase [Thiobacillus sp.]
MNADERGQIEAVLAGTERAAVVCADVLTGLAAIGDGAVDCIVTSPPYWGLRRYSGVEGGEWPEVTYQPMSGIPTITVPAERSCFGLESTIEAYVAHTVLIGRELRRVLADHGTLWWDIGSCYWSGEPTEMVLREDLTEEERAFVLRELAACKPL